MANTNHRDEWIDTGHQSDNISQEYEGSQNTTASAAIRQSIAGESRYRDARVPSDVAGQILHRIHEERKLQHEIDKAALVVEEHKLRMFDKIANEITNGEAREVRIGDIISRLGPAIEGSRGEQEALVANLGQAKPQKATTDLQQLHVPLEASQLRFENWDWRLRGRNIRIAFSDEENQDARDVGAPIEVYHVRLLRNAEKNCSRLVIDFNTADTARIEARRAAAASREAILSGSADDLADAAVDFREEDVHEDLADAPRNLHLTREAEHLAYASAATHDSASNDGESEKLPETASPRVNTHHSIASLHGASARETQVADDERDHGSSHDNEDELVTPAATKSASSAHDKQLSPSQKRSASSAESAAAETARQVRELDTAPSEENEQSALVSADHPSRERLLLAFLKRKGFVLGHVEPPFTIDALLRPGHLYREGTSRREHDYFYVDTDLESALTEFPELREEFAAFECAHSGSADTALTKEQKTAASSSRCSNSVSASQTQEVAFDNRAARVLFLDMLGPLHCQDYVDYFVARGWALGGLQGRGGKDASETSILIRPKHRFKVDSSVRGQDFVGRENEAELREYILESAAVTEDFGRFRIERADSGKRGVFSETTSPSHLPTFFAQLRSKNALKTSQTDLTAMELRSVCELTRDMLEDDAVVKENSRCAEKDEDQEQNGSEHGPDSPSKSQKQVQTRFKRKRNDLNSARNANMTLAGPRSGATNSKAAKAKTAAASRLPSTFTASSGSDHGTARSLMPAPLSSAALSKTSTSKRVRYASLVEATENHSTREESSKSSNSIHVSEESGKTQGAGLVIDFSTEFEPAGQSRKGLLREAACGSSAWIKEPSEAHLGVRHESKDTSFARKLHVCPICYAWAIDDLIADSNPSTFLPSAACVLPDPIDVFCHGGDLVGAAGMCLTSVDAVSQHLLQAHNVSPSEQSKAIRVLERHRLFSPHLDGFGASRDGLINTYVRQLVGRRHSPKSSAQEYFESRSRTQLIARIFGIVQRSMQRLLVFPEARYHMQSRATWEILVEPLDTLLHVLPLSQKKVQAQGKSSSKRSAYDSRETWAQDGENLFFFCGRYSRKSFRSVHIDDLPYLHYWQDRLERDATEAHLQIFARLAAWFEAEPPLDMADCDHASSDEEEHGGARQASSRNTDAWTHYGKSHKVSLGKNLAEMTFWDAFSRYPMLCVSLKKRKELPAALAAFCNWLHRSDAHPIMLARSPTRASHSRSRARR